MNVFLTTETGFEVRPWGGRMCFLGTEDSVGSKLLGVTAVLRMGQKLTHSTHTHDNCDEVILVLGGEGRQIFVDGANRETAYDLHEDDLLYIAKNRMHRTDNLSLTGDLELFIINYFCQGQSDASVKGFIPAGSIPREETPYGACSKLITEDTCGNRSITGELATVLPGKRLEAHINSKEAFFFCVSGSARISAGDSQAELPTHAQAFLFQGESCRIENTTPSPLRLFCVYAD